MAIKTKLDSEVKLRVNTQTYIAKKTDDLYGYNKHTFSIKAKNIDSGTIIIKKDGQTIEVPFEYKYFKFWH